MALSRTTMNKQELTGYSASGRGLASRAELAEDGRITVSFNLKKALPDLPKDYAKEVNVFAADKVNYRSPPRMSVVIMIVGSRGDVQPFVALGKRLQQDGHRVRIATHGKFVTFVREHGIEFFDIGGDPEDLMSYMVKNPGLVPGLESIKNGDIGRKRSMLKEMLDGCWRACFEPDSENGATFAADAIISNPPAFAHVHCAEALGVPLVLSFTMPWCATTAYPHPLVNVVSSNAKQGLTNYLTYALTDIMTWQGLGSIIDDFREKKLGLSELSIRKGPSVVDTLKIPWTYCMSPALVPKPNDWKSHIDVVGFYFLDLSTNYRAPDDLAAFLDAGPCPIYIGFGSIVVDDPTALTTTIFQATKNAGVRALVSAGWGGLGSGTVPDHVFILGNVPHDWLFNKVRALVHHGGAGTTAIGLRMAKPTLVVPFFGDQPFWGQMIHESGAGPLPIRHKDLNTDNLTEAIKFCLRPASEAAAKRLSENILSEDGVTNGVLSFYRHLPLLNMRCDLAPKRIAVWWSTEHCLRLSAFAAETLSNYKLIEMNKLAIHRAAEYDHTKKVTDPITGGVSSIFWTVTNHYAAIAQIFYKGIINTTVAVPRGVLEIIASIHEGLHNMPQLYGSEVRESEKVKDFSSGLTAAGKGFFYGYYDGITGLVKEPVEGGRKEGVIGAIKGSARSFVNATVRPAAGIVGLLSQPLQGASASIARKFAKPPIQVCRSTRVSDGLRDVERAAQAETDEVLRAWKEATTPEIERARKEEYKKMAKEVLLDAKDDEVEKTDSNSEYMTGRNRETGYTQGALNASTSNATSSISADEESWSRELDMALQLSLQTPASESHRSDDAEEKQYLKDLERARRMSLESSH